MPGIARIELQPPLLNGQTFVFGQFVQVIARFTDSGNTAVVVTDPRLEITPPGASAPTVYTPTSSPPIVSNGVGVWQIDLTPSVAGDWALFASCTGAFAATTTTAFRVGPQDVGGQLPPVVVSSDLGPVVGQRGGVLRGVRVRNMRRLTSVPADTLVYVVPPDGVDSAVLTSAIGGGGGTTPPPTPPVSPLGGGFILGGSSPAP